MLYLTDKLRQKLIDATRYEGDECGWDDTNERIALLNAPPTNAHIPTHLDLADIEDETAIPPIQYVALTIDYFGLNAHTYQ